MTLETLILYIGIIALVLTLLIGFLKKGHRSWVMTFLQNFCGVLFIFSGWVKAVDPMGTAFKMEQYFTEFQSTAQGTWFGFIAPVFPWLSHHAIWFSVFMIILEIVVGVMLILGHHKKLTSWVFLLVILFFTMLTGFTYLTGYVPTEANFFAFDQWGPYTATNMRVTDCGCFGDFLKLQPKTSFLKDVFLLIPALVFVFRHKHMHNLFSAHIRNLVGILLPFVLLYYCLSNFLWHEPHVDFRPFKVGVNIAEQKRAEEEAQSSVRILTWTLKNQKDGQIVELSNDEYMGNFKSYPSDTWEVVSQTKTEPAIPETKISHFEMTDLDGNDVTEEILENPDPVLLVVCYKLKGDETYVEKTFQDSTYALDSVFVGDQTYVVRTLSGVQERKEMVPEYTWDKDYTAIFKGSVDPLVDAASEQGFQVFSVAGAAAEDAINAFTHEVGARYPMFEADDIMLKTIMRSDPGLVLLKGGRILGKWHYCQLPTLEELKSLAGK